MSKPKLVLIGNGMAGVKTLEELLQLTPDKYNITVFGSEPHGNYNRILLSPLLAGEKAIDDIMINDLQWYRDNNITLHTSKTVVDINRANRLVIANDGTQAPYDKLILATGSNPVILDLPGKDLEGIISFRDISDVDTMIATAKTHRKAVVIGGGLLGLEAANGLMIQGMDVTVVHRSNTLMSQQLDQTAADLMQSELEAKGFKFLMNHNTAAYLGKQRVEKIRFTDGSEIEADLVIIAAGIRPNIALAESVGIHCERGIIVDDTLQTYTPNIYAVGECVQHRKNLFGLVAPVFEQATVCANHLAEIGIQRYINNATFTKLKVTGIDLFSAGDYRGDADGDTESESILLSDPAKGHYKKLVVKDNQLTGVVLYGDTLDGNWYFSLIMDKTDIQPLRDNLLFGQHHFSEDAEA